MCESCQTIFPSPISVASGSSGSITGTTAICPKCAATGKILDGVYQTLDNAVYVLLRHPNPEVLRPFISILQGSRYRLLRDGRERDNLADKIKDATPELQSIGDALPKTRTDLYAFVSMLIAAAIFLNSDCLSKPAEKPQPTIEVKQHYIDKSITHIYKKEATDNQSPDMEPPE